MARALPPPAARVAIAAVETTEVFAERWSPWAARLGIDDPTELSVLADGTEWNWDQLAMSFPGAAEVLDIYHAGEHLADASKEFLGEGIEAAFTQAAMDELAT